VEAEIDESDGVYPWYPDHSNSRLTAQEGCFTIFPLRANSEPLEPMAPDRDDRNIEELIKVLVPAEAKNELRRELKLLGVTHQTMFPSLDGLATRIRRDLSLPW